MQRHVLTDIEWVRLRSLLPSRSRTGRPPKDHQCILDALLWLARTFRALADGGDPVLPLDQVGTV